MNTLPRSEGARALQAVLVAALLSACAMGPGPDEPADADLRFAMRLAELVDEDQLLQPDHGSAPRPGDWRFVYRQDLTTDTDRPCEPRYRMSLDAAREGFSRQRLLACSGASADRRCETVTLPMDRVQGLSIHQRPDSGPEEPDAWWFVLDFAAAPAEGEPAWSLDKAFLTTSDSRHLLLAETLEGLAGACGGDATGGDGP